MSQKRNEIAARNHRLKVIGAGFGRTGTWGLKELMNNIGFGECYHGITKFYNPYHNDFWGKIADMEKNERTNVNWNDFYYDFQGKGIIYNSAVDWPTAACWREIAEFYPDCKVILGVRDPEKWYHSMTKGLFPKLTVFDYCYWGYLLIPSHRKEWDINNKLYCNQFGGIFHMHEENKHKKQCMELFEKHIKNVKEYFKNEQIQKGWKQSRLFIYNLERKDTENMKLELLEFLGVDTKKYKYVIQTGPKNTTKQLQILFQEWNRRFRLQVITTFLWIGSVGYICRKKQ
eukprot:510269_1